MCSSGKPGWSVTKRKLLSSCHLSARRNSRNYNSFMGLLRYSRTPRVGRRSPAAPVGQPLLAICSNHSRVSGHRSPATFPRPILHPQASPSSLAELHRPHNSFALFHHDHLIGLHVLQCVDRALGRGFCRTRFSPLFRCQSVRANDFARCSLPPLALHRSAGAACFRPAGALRNARARRSRCGSILCQ